MSYPIQPGKVQAPALRDETLARTRLLDWLEVKIHSRVIFLIADAGYGKTTLLADFSRRTRLRTIWYRLDDDDRDWVGFLSHLVAAGREHDPEFAPRTTAMLRSLEPGGPTREDVVEAFMGELPSIAAEGVALIFDDFHLADEIADVRAIAREIVTRAPERLSVVFASRRQPPIPVSKLRTLGEVAELGIADLRFSDTELEQLFRETYGRPLEPDVLTELARRTEGWAASLTLVQAALRERSPAETRSFVRGLSGARDELHDYLAEEVVGDLPQIHQRFLMQTSILQIVTPELAQVATGLTAVEVQSLILESERLGLLGRRPNRRLTAQRYHPLVREFLEERLRHEVGASGVDQLHVTVARWAESTDWRTAAYHYASAERWSDLQRVLDMHVETIVGSGDFLTAAGFIHGSPDASRSAAAHVILSREATTEGDLVGVQTHAEQASALSPRQDIVVGNLIMARMMVGSYAAAAELAEGLVASASSPFQREIALANWSMIQASLDGDLREFIGRCEKFAERSAREGLLHFEGVSWLNVSIAYIAIGKIDRARECAQAAIDALSHSSSGAELASAKSILASISARTGSLKDARRQFDENLAAATGANRGEVLGEYAETETEVGDASKAELLLSGRSPGTIDAVADLIEMVRTLLLIRAADFTGAMNALLAIELDKPAAYPGFQSRLRAWRAVAMALCDRPEAFDTSIDAVRFAEAQGAETWRSLAGIAMGHASDAMNASVLGVTEQTRFVISLAAELVVRNLHNLGAEAAQLVAIEAASVPERWRPPLREAISSDAPSRIAAARLLDVVGESRDVATLRQLAKSTKRSGLDRSLGRGLARRLAQIVEIRDLGRLSIRLGDEVVLGSAIRRKVSALLCFLLTRPRWAATREEVMEAMWPDMDPSAAVNSLNQSVYFLRRVFEPEYTEETTAGYVQQDTDLLWLDQELIHAASSRCAQLASEFSRVGDPGLVVELVSEYEGRFALDFAYDEWATDYREWLHVAYLQAVETQIRSDVDHGRYQRGIAIARAALEVEPRNEELELSLLKLLRGSGAHSAAAEQYSRYSNVLRRDLGVEPPPWDAL